MSEHEFENEALERLEWKDSKHNESPQSKARAVTRRAALGGGAGALAAFMLSPAAQALAASDASIFGSQKKYHFVFVNHVTTNSFFTATIYGIQDACNLLGCSYQWTGSENSVVSQMVTAFNSAITSGADGIACAMISPSAFTPLVSKALGKNIPVVAYNADEPNGRLAYIGEDLEQSGVLLGGHILQLVGSGDVAVFIATPGTANIQPRADGVLSALKGTKVNAKQFASGALQPQELSAIEAFWPGHTDYKGLFAVDSGSTISVGQTIQKYKLKGKVKSGGYDLTVPTPTLLQQGFLDVTIDQQPYLQGFLPVLEMFLYHASDGLSGIADINTGLKFVTPSTVAGYVAKKSRFEGSSTKAGVS
ncbi:MAG TPA: substrate-binding domain-containing protein [Solirubrobacteraceae bacterium]|nr:substrate-binding domain-containing protein [Solirubrobacteraceae bacterium]